MGREQESGIARLRHALNWWNSPRGIAALLMLIILLAFALRLYRLGYQSIWYDEGVSLHLAMKDLRSLTLHTAGDIHPPLYYYLLHFWIRAAGQSEFSAAFLSLMFGVLLVALSYRLADGLCGGPIGLLAAFLTAISPFNLWYSQEIRMYTLGAVLGVISLYCLMRLTGMMGRQGRGARRWYWLGYVLSAAAGLYALYYFALLLLAENLFVFGWWLFQRLGRKSPPLSLVRWLLVQGVVLLLYLPWLPIALRQALAPPVPPWRGFAGLGTTLIESWAALSLGQSVDPESILIWPLLSFLFAVYLLALLKPPAGDLGKARTILLCVYTFAPLLFIYALSVAVPLFHVRYMFTYSPPFYLLLALGFVRLREISRPALVVGLLVLIVASGYSIYNFHFGSEYAADDHRGAVTYLQDRIAPGDAVLINAGYAYPPFLYYYQGEIAWRGRLPDYEPSYQQEDGVVILQTGVIGGDPGLGWGDPASDFYSTTERETAQVLERLFAAHPRVWVYRIYDTVTDPDGFIRAWLEEHGRILGDMQFAGEGYMRVQCYLTAPSPEYEAEKIYHPLDIAFAQGLRLVGYEGPEGVRAGDLLPLTLYWQADRTPQHNYEVVLRLRARDGPDFAWHRAPQSPPTSQWPTGQIVSQTVDLWVLGGTPPLRYDLVVEPRYDGAAGEALSLVDRDVTIGSIVVAKPLVPQRPRQMDRDPWANFGNLLQLVGYWWAPHRTQPGEEIRLELLWRVWDAPLPMLDSTVELRDAEGRVEVSERGGYVTSAYPSILWESEEFVREERSIRIPEDIGPGDHALTLTLRAARTTGQSEIIPFWSSSGAWQETFTLATVEVANP
jgi:mannosyltransferase